MTSERSYFAEKVILMCEWKIYLAMLQLKVSSNKFGCIPGTLLPSKTWSKDQVPIIR
jgi:hypothetical protein